MCSTLSALSACWEVLNQLWVPIRPLSLTPSHAWRISLVGFILSQVLEVQSAALDELVQGLLCAHQLLQLLPQLLLLCRPGGVFKYSPASGTEQPPVSELVQIQEPHSIAALMKHGKLQYKASHKVCNGALWVVRTRGGA
jgi:hypothetical protein